jgi:hypothetical protein
MKSCRLCFDECQSTIDYVGYVTGQTDEWRGTGVWSGLSLKRDNNDESKKKDETIKSKEASESNRDPVGSQK